MIPNFVPDSDILHDYADALIVPSSYLCSSAMLIAVRSYCRIRTLSVYPYLLLGFYHSYLHSRNLYSVSASEIRSTIDSKLRSI